MLTPENIVEFTWRKAYPASSSQETIEQVLGLLEQREEEGLHSMYHAARLDAESAGESAEFPSILRWLAHQRVIDFVEYGDVAFRDLRPLTVFSMVESLAIPVAPDADLAPLSDLLQLRNLTVKGAKDGNYEFVGQLRQLEALSIFGNGGHGLEACSQLAHLKKLTVEHVAVDLESLAESESLLELSLNDCELTSLSPLRRLSKTRVLRVPNNWVHDLTPLAACKSLAVLNCDNNCIRDFTPLDHLPGLSHEDKAAVRNSPQRSASL